MESEDLEMETLSSDSGVDSWLEPSYGALQLQQSNSFDNVTTVQDFIQSPNFTLFLLSLVCAISWIVYITFYSSRVTGLVLTKIANRFIKSGYIKIGSLSLSVLSGKVMFRDVAYITEDFSVRVQDGWVIFRWWRAYVPKDISEDMSHSDTRLSILLNGCEYHLYNRSEFYCTLEKLFGLDPHIIPGGSKNPDKGDSVGKSHPKPPSAVGYSWRDLIPVIKLELCSGRVVFGNMLVPYTLAVVVEEAHLIYTTKPAASKLDHFMHIVKCRGENFKVLLSQSPKYTGLKDEPPRLMGEGFGILTSNKVELYYYMDEPGVVPNEPEMLLLANGDKVEANPPIWGIDIKCGKGTDFSYGPWADRQRDQLYRIFFPQDYQPLKPTSPPSPGEERQIQSFDIRVSTLNDATIDILFSKDQETNAVHMNISPGSYLEITIPWVVHSDGYATKITGQFLHLEASTSLQFRNLVNSETLQFNIKSHYPLHWNDHQEWVLNLTGCKASAYLTYAHKWFFQALINDWSSRTPPDLLHFVPYTWKINFCLKEFELITPANEYNWIDCSSQHHENMLVAACGELFELSFDLPFDEFLPETVPFKFWIQVEGGDLNFYIPEVSTAHVTIDALRRNGKILNRDGSIKWNLAPPENTNVSSKATGGNSSSNKVKRWRNICQPSSGWIECWSVPICAVSIAFTYHPMPPLGPTPQADVTTPEKEELLLSPIRMPGDRDPSRKVETDSDEVASSTLITSDFDPLTLPADKVHVELEVGPSVLLLYGTLLKLLINLKENVFGDSQDFIDMEKLKSGCSSNYDLKSTNRNAFTNAECEASVPKLDLREYRPLEVTVSCTLHDIRAHLLKNCSEKDPPCPTICIERFGFEMNKKYKETLLQVLLSPIMLIASDNFDRSESGDKHLQEGYLMLSGLQVRGHAMFSNDGRSLDQETLEYGWLIEIQLGKLSGRLTTPHLENIVTSCETFFILVLDVENSLRSSQSFLMCHHGNNQFECPLMNIESYGVDSGVGCGSGEDIITETIPSTPNTASANITVQDIKPIKICPTAEDIKYKMVRVSVDAIDIYLVEGGTALSLWVSPIRFSTCNLHGYVMKEGFTLLVPNVQLRHFVMVNPSFTKFQFSDLNIIQSSSETMTASWTSKVEPNTSIPQSPTSTSAQSWSYLWLEAGAVAFGPLCIEMAMKGNTSTLATQSNFLVKHDRKTKRLWFLWKPDKNDKNKDSGGNESTKLNEKVKKCGCVGGCSFFGSNKSGDRFFWPSRKDWVDGINVACFRVNKPGEDVGFGQSILKSSVLVFDTPPYTTQGASLLELHSEWTRETIPKSGKAPFTFKPSLLADLSHTSSSVPSNRSDRVSNVGSTLQSSKARRFSQPSQPGIKRQSRISESLQLRQGSDTKLNCDEDENLLKPPSTEQSKFSGRAGSCSSDSKLGVEHFQSVDETEESMSADESSKTLPKPLTGSLSATETEETVDETLNNLKKPWAGSFTSLDSLSDVSFISALSVQEECMVNLQMHLNKPIAESSLLMPCYMSHLTQLKCDNWHVTAPVIASDSIGLAPFVQNQDGKLIYAASKYTPFFEPLVDGFTTLAMVGVDCLSDSLKRSPPSSSCMNTPSQTHFWETPTGTGFGRPDHMKDKFDSNSDEEFYRTVVFSESHSLAMNTSSECTTIVVRTKNDINIMVSPMLLEALQKFIEAMTPTLSHLHPLSVVNHLHNKCISRVEKANLLKKEKSILLSKIQNSKRNTAIRMEEASPVHANIYEEITQTAIQGSISLPKINVTLLQASVVEEVISFSALDNIRDLMCVSMLAVAIEKTNIHFLFREQTKKTVQVLHRPSILPKAQKKRKSKVSTTESMLSEPVFIENSEQQSELVSTSVDIHRIHAQLRRLKNDSSILREAVITAIPNQHSKVLFRFAKIPSGLQDMKDSACSDSSRDNAKESMHPSNPGGESGDMFKAETESHSSFNPSLAQTRCPDEKLGFIMCECGLEGISLKGVKNIEAPTKHDEKEETVSVTLCNENYNVPDRTSTPNLASTIETFASDKEATIVGDSREDFLTDSICSNPKPPPTEIECQEIREIDKKVDTANASCVIQFQIMWYNFAAPPQTPITRKIDYTRVDWNLVSTASTAINAWLNPIDQLTLAIISLIRGYGKRSTGLLASLMAEALDVQAIHQPIKSKYGKLTPLAKTLQEDPSCQLCIVLQRYISLTTSAEIEANVSDVRLPQLSTLRQGVIVLSRQWKNVLYTPLLLEHNLKSKKSKNFTVTFTLPQSEEESPGSEGELSAEETTDERATLLDTEGGTVSLQSMRFKRSRGSNVSTLSESSCLNNTTAHKTLPTQSILSSTRASDVYPYVEDGKHPSVAFTGLNSVKDKRKSDSVASIVTGNWSTSTEDSENNVESEKSTPGKSNKKLNQSSIIRQVNAWNANNEAAHDAHDNKTQTARLSTMMSEQSHEESLLLGAHSKFPQHPSLMLLDAHVIFQPLLSSMGLMPQQIMGYSLDKWGSHMSIRASIDVLKIDIVESEGKGVGRGSFKGTSKHTNSFVLNIPPETPAFLCEKIVLEGDFQKSTDLSRTVLSNKSMIYLSRNYWKKQTKSAIIFSLNIDYISQQVNMPLLRLLHQITTMYQNVRETQMELREQRPVENVDSNVLHKNSSSSGSDIPDQVLASARAAEKKSAKSMNIPSTNVQPPNNNTNTLTPPTTNASTVRAPMPATRTQSFAQRFKSTSKAVIGHKGVLDGMRTSSASQTPTSVRDPEFPDGVAKSQPSEGNVTNAIAHPNCWKTIYYLLDLYATRPETKTIINNRSQIMPDGPDAYHARALRLNSGKAYDAKDHLDDIEKGLTQETLVQPTYATSSLEKQKDSVLENPRISVFGVARIQRTRLLASLSGLKLEAEITNLQASCCYKKKLRPVAVDLNLTGHVGQAMIVLLEGIAPNQQTVVKVSVSKSGALYSSVSKRSKDKNCALLTIGPVNIDIPQHPVVLHGMMTRSTKQLSNTLQEFRVNRTSSRISRGTTFDEVDFAAHLPHLPQHVVPEVVPEKQKKAADTALFQPLVMQFTIVVESLSITAALLPSLQAQYKMEKVKSCGVTGSKAKFQITLPAHTLSFTTKLTIPSAEANLPSAASISLPEVNVLAEYIQDGKSPADAQILDGVVLRHGNYLSATANIGTFEHCLTTDLLNHLVFVQKVFMKEVNEVVLKMSGGDKPVPLWDDESSSSLRSLLFTLVVNLTSIQITATTPTNTAVRLETGQLEFQMSNRVQGMTTSYKHNSKVPPTNTMSTNNSSSSHPRPAAFYNKVFIKAQVDVNLSLGQLIRNMVFEEADSEYQQYAFFKTRIGLRNALSDEMSGADADKEVVLITLFRPLIYVQPIAVDKAILVWLNYKNAYEYWNEQRSSLNTEVLAAMPAQVTVDRPQINELHEQSSILFLQLTVDDMGISIPLNPSPHSWGGRGESENRGAVVVTLESTSISACSSGSLVSKGRFTGLCFRFTDDMVSMDDWKPNLHDPTVMNFCVVSEGTYEVCSRTTSQYQQSENAKWFLNVKWQMEGVDMHIDVNIGKQLSALGHTLTTLAAFEEEEDENSSERENMLRSQDLLDYSAGTPGRSLSQESVTLRRQKSQAGDSLPSFVTDLTLGPRQKRTLLEKEMNERVTLIAELKRKGASNSIIEDERRRLQELENVAFRDFRRDWMKKLRRQSTKAASIKDKFGLGSSKPLHMRSKSLAVSSPESESQYGLGRFSSDPIFKGTLDALGLSMDLAIPVDLAPSPSSDSSPREGPSRSSSLRFNRAKQRVTFGEAQRQYSVDSANNVTTPEDDDEFIGVWLENESSDSKSGLDGDAAMDNIGGHMTPGSSTSHKAQEPNVDLELDVKVFINSGKCVLHTKPKDEDAEIRARKKSERSGSGYDSLLHIGSPMSSRKNRQAANSSRIKSPFGNTATQTDVTVFHIPGLDVKIHYDSHILYDYKERDVTFGLGRPTHERSDSGSSSGTTGGLNQSLGRKCGIKKGNLFAWTTLHSVPEETIISPHILDFLEQTLEPIPLPANQKSFDGASMATDAASGVASTYYASFPVDVVVYFHMQPSTFRFSCQPVSRVECMLRLPSLEIVFSSKRAEEEQDEFGCPSVTKLKSSRYSGDLGMSKEKELGGSSSQHLAVGGLSVTGCLSDFSVYIFHPYGAAKKSAGEWSPLSDNERKDSVSMNVEFVKFNLSRSRKIHVTVANPTVERDSKNFHQNSTEQQQAAIRFSTIVDIGSASFKYDMRRLTEILAFPKAWYRRSIVRRLFLGDLSTASTVGDDSSSTQGPASESDSPLPSRAEERRNSVTSGFPTSQKEKLRLNLELEKERRRGAFPGSKTSSKALLDEFNNEPASGASSWETLVLFAVNFTKLNVQMNMGNVMGNVSWLIRDAKSEGRLSIGSTGHKNLYIGIGLDSSHIDAKGGIVAGTFELTHLNTFLRSKEDPGVEPHHTVGFKMYGLELRLDFMGTSVLMGRVSGLEVTLKDEWQVRGSRRPQSDVALATYRPAMIFIHGDMCWDQLQLMISKSTTVDLLKMHCKLEEFFSQQFKSSKWVFSTLQVESSSSASIPKKQKKKIPETGMWEELRHHRHWQQVLEKVSLLNISSLLMPLPQTGTVLGGTMDLHGSNISLACFHGVNFKAKSWALFSLKQPLISFSTEAQETHSQDLDMGAVHVVQNLNFSLGQQNQQAMTINNSHHESMAIVCRITRNVMFPPQFRTLQEWFHYAFAPSEIDDVHRFPSLERERERMDRERADSGGSERRTPARLHDPNHNREVIFALPSMELFFKTEHFQACKTPETTGTRPIVECSFITEFGDHIFVTVDAEAFFFLHDLITSYIKEKEKLVSAQLAAGRSQSPSLPLGERDGHVKTSSTSSASSDDTSYSFGNKSTLVPPGMDEATLQRDWREFHCKTWQLEPTVRLLSWSAELGYGVDYILHKLGFSHARITIPKWMQRGFMDPLDKVLSVLVFRMIDVAKSENQNRES